MHFGQYIFTQIASSLLTKDDIMELFTSTEDEDEPDDGQLEMEFTHN